MIRRAAARRVDSRIHRLLLFPSGALGLGWGWNSKKETKADAAVVDVCGRALHASPFGQISGTIWGLMYRSL